MLAAGTAAALVPIKSITMESKGDKFLFRDGSDEPGPVWTKLITTLKGIQLGKIEDKQGWLYRVDKPEQWGSNKTNGAKETVDELP